MKIKPAACTSVFGLGAVAGVCKKSGDGGAAARLDLRGPGN
jgi:hypothetical protein